MNHRWEKSRETSHRPRCGEANDGGRGGKGERKKGKKKRKKKEKKKRKEERRAGTGKRLRSMNSSLAKFLCLRRVVEERVEKEGAGWREGRTKGEGKRGS